MGGQKLLNQGDSPAFALALPPRKEVVVIRAGTTTENQDVSSPVSLVSSPKVVSVPSPEPSLVSPPPTFRSDELGSVSPRDRKSVV